MLLIISSCSTKVHGGRPSDCCSLDPSPVDVLKLCPKNIKLVRSVVFNYIETYSKELFNFIATGKVEVNVHKVYSLKDVGLANSDLEGRHTTGKPVLKG